ncbi:iron-containing alcohol dehydrogenase [Clostridium sp. WILCCON 0269]|uniref:Iron-containing alcohol dehydrogenase n=1 Tax=Candidatus Clostridium eludens TaxID=3381663 RepID=A0ABW8SNN2_9CLOT
MENIHDFLCPSTNLIGMGSIKDLPTYLMPHKLSKALIVTDKNIISLGYVEMIETILKSLFISYDIFDGILHPNSTVSFVEDGLAYFNKGLNPLKRNYRFIISVGGGTCHDCAKGIATVAANGGSIADYEGYKKMTKPSLPTISINTTSGSGSEISNFVILTDESRRLKMVIGDPKLMPLISVNDPMFMPTMPPEVTASSGMDAATHAIESFISTEASPTTDALAIGALKIVFKYLKRAYDNGNDMEAREQMMYANVMAGMAFNNAGLGLVHAITHQIGGFYQQIHGVCNSVILPYVIEFNSVSVPEERILKLCTAVGERAVTQDEAIYKIKHKIESLSNDMNLPLNLKNLGVKEKDLEFLSKNAVKDICILTNPRQTSVEDVLNIFKTAM